MKKPTLHLICNAHLDPVWLWRWEEGAAAAVTTFAIAARLLREFPTFVFNHNEAILYRWVQELNPPLFAEIQQLVRQGRWCISGGWDLQPDVNMPGTEALIRHIAEGQRYFKEHFGAEPRVAYNLDSFGHSGGLPQLMAQAGYVMYVHMRPEAKDLVIPSDLYRWVGIDGTEIAVYRIPFPAYNTFHGVAVERIRQAAEIALHLNRDTPVFWGLGDHGGGATRKELELIQEYINAETRVNIIHSTTERFHEAIKDLIPSAPVIRGDLQRVFTGCYTSMARVKRRMQKNLAELLQTEGARAASWWLRGQPYPEEQLRDAWRDHLFNDFHDILPGSCIEPGEQDALDLYGRSSETHRRLRLGAIAGFTAGQPRQIEIPVTVLAVNPAAHSFPVEFEYAIDHVPKLQGQWHARMFTLDGTEVPLQEEPPEMYVLTDEWRRRLCLTTSLPQVGAAHYTVEMREGPYTPKPTPPAVRFSMNPVTARVATLETPGGIQVLAADLLQAYVVDDTADSWGMERWRYDEVDGEFALLPGSSATIVEGPVRTIREATYTYRKSTIVLRTIAYADQPFLEFRLRIIWNEPRKRLKLSFPTRMRGDAVYCEVPGGAIHRPADGEEHSHGRWLLLDGSIDGAPCALAVVNSGEHGFDCRNGDIRLSILRSAPYAFERGFTLSDPPHRKVMDLGVHEVRLLVAAGSRGDILPRLHALAEWLCAPPYALAHHPIGEETPAVQELLRLAPSSLRLLACKQSWDGAALIIRIQETIGEPVTGQVSVTTPATDIPLRLQPFAITTIRVEKNGSWREVGLISET